MFCIEKKITIRSTFFKHSSIGDFLILIFACSYISYVVEPKKNTSVICSFLNFFAGET